MTSTHLVVSFLEMQRKLKQTKVDFKYSFCVRIETIYKPSKVATAKNFLVCIFYFNVFFISCDSGRHSFL